MNKCCDKCDARQIPPVPGGISCWDENCECHIIASLLAALKSARTQLEDYERLKTGETYNDTQINTAIVKAEGRQS